MSGEDIDPREAYLHRISREAAEADAERRRLYSLWQQASQRYVELARLKTEAWRAMVAGGNA